MIDLWLPTCTHLPGIDAEPCYLLVVDLDELDMAFCVTTLTVKVFVFALVHLGCEFTGSPLTTITTRANELIVRLYMVSPGDARYND